MKRKPHRRDDLDPALRELVLARDQHTCQAAVRGFPHHCFGGLHVHHRLPLGRGGKHTLDNLIAVCTSAHDRLHNVDRAGAYALGLLLRSS
jgi:5-methylcytosine-specific restriction endonuclease McrA